MTRQKPPQRRASWTYTIATKGDVPLKAHVTVGMYPDGAACEVFVRMSKVGSPLQAAFDTWARTASRSLQEGVPLSRIAKSLRGTGDGTCSRMIHHDDKVTDCGSLWDAIAQTLERHDI